MTAHGFISTSLEDLAAMRGRLDSRNSIDALSPYQKANLEALSRFVSSNIHHGSRRARFAGFNLFLDDAYSSLSSCVGFSPPSGANNIAIIDPLMINSHFYKKAIQQAFAFPSYSNRKDSAYWRGALTGYCSPPAPSNDYIETILTLPRVKLCRASAENRHILDCKITSTDQWLFSESIYSLLQADGLTSSVEPFDLNYRHKYLIDIDGNSNSWPGFFLKLGSGSCVFKCNSDNRFYQWYYKYLSPWTHYVPVESDLSDLLEKIMYIKANPLIGESIALNSLRFVAGKSARRWSRLAMNDLSVALEMT